MDAETSTENTLLNILLLTSSILVIVDIFEFVNILKSWGNINSIPYNLFETCLKWPFYTGTLFCVYSLLGAISAFILIVSLVIDSNYFIHKILPTFRFFNYIIFGPYMLGFCLIGFYNFNDVVYVCDKQNMNNKILSQSNLLTLVACFILSSFITGLVLMLKTFNIYFNSILSRPGGSPIIKKLFWKIIFRNREPIQFVRSVQRENEERKEEDA